MPVCDLIVLNLVTDYCVFVHFRFAGIFSRLRLLYIYFQDKYIAITRNDTNQEITKKENSSLESKYTKISITSLGKEQITCFLFLLGKQKQKNKTRNSRRVKKGEKKDRHQETFCQKLVVMFWISELMIWIHAYL